MDPVDVEAALHEREQLRIEIERFYRQPLPTPFERVELDKLIRRSGYLRRWIAARNRVSHNQTSWALLSDALHWLHKFPQPLPPELLDLITDIKDHVPEDYRRKHERR